MRYLTAAGPFVRRRFKPPHIPRPQPAATLRYGEHAPCLANIYVPVDGGKDAPTALVVHGGGFVGGARDMSSVLVVVDRLLQSGTVVASVDYRLARPWGARLEGQRQDVMQAARWWRELAPEYGGNPDDTTLVGLSAGGGLALYAAQAVVPRRFVGIYGAYDLTLLPVRWFTASTLARTPRRHEQAARSPLHVGDFDAPALLIHGRADPLAVPEHTERLARLRAERGLPTDTVWIDDAVHGFFQDGPEHPHSQLALDRMQAFMEAQPR